MIPQVPRILDRIKEIHEKKNQDYAQETNPWSNFERMAELASWFDSPVHKSFANMMGVKLARLAELLNGKTPKNESIDDTFLDACTYMVLWMSYYENQTEDEPHVVKVDYLVQNGFQFNNVLHYWFNHGVIVHCSPDGLIIANMKQIKEAVNMAVNK